MFIIHGNGINAQARFLLYQPLTEPIMTPFTKYFCRKG